jgi:hypothetical protein
MGYLLMQLLWYVLAAFAVGLVVGWITCTRVESNER